MTGGALPREDERSSPAEAAGEGPITFFGRVLPERTFVTLPALDLKFAVPPDAVGKSPGAALRVHINSATVVVRVERSTIGDLLWLRNLVGVLVGSYVDAFGYARGCGYRVEITGSDQADSSNVFGVSMPVLAVGEEDALAAFRVIADLVLNDPEGRARPLRRALADLREAILNADDGPFYCFRAVEALAYAWDHNPRRGMKRMCTDLRLDERWVHETLDRPAAEIRHGKVVFVCDETRVITMLAARAITERFALRLLVGGPLVASEYPLLGTEVQPSQRPLAELLRGIGGGDTGNQTQHRSGLRSEPHVE